MIAYLPPKPDKCDACGSGPCHDGTLCSGSHRAHGWDEWPLGRVEIAPAMAYRDFSIKVTRELRHPKYQDQPRSPKPGIRKRR